MHVKGFVRNNLLSTHYWEIVIKQKELKRRVETQKIAKSEESVIKYYCILIYSYYIQGPWD